jgi:hypothetical protein
MGFGKVGYEVDKTGKGLYPMVNFGDIGKHSASTVIR